MFLQIVHPLSGLLGLFGSLAFLTFLPLLSETSGAVGGPTGVFLNKAACLPNTVAISSRNVAIFSMFALLAIFIGVFYWCQGEYCSPNHRDLNVRQQISAFKSLAHNGIY